MWCSGISGLVLRQARRQLTFSATCRTTASGAYTSGAAARYDPRAVEEKWNPKMLAPSPPSAAAAAAGDGDGGKAGKYYALSMFPYPSGSLHMGHVRVYTISDCIARFRRMQGHDVIHPMGWDAFGLPAENAAVERGADPATWTKSNVASMRGQMDELGLNFDWDRSVTTCDPSYYRWTQWLFLKLHGAGLAYRQEAMVNWDPIDQTVLANEQVDADGRSWRSGAVVEKKLLNQWFLRITEFADRLLSGADGLKWPPHVLDMQRSWIGRSEGFQFQFEVEKNGDSDGGVAAAAAVVAFTTRPDTIYGATFLSVATDHPLTGHPAVTDAVRAAVAGLEARDPDNSDSDDDGGAVPLGMTVRHPLTGATLPVLASAHVVSGYGSGAVIGVPAHDARDHRIATAHGLSIVQVIKPLGDGDGDRDWDGDRDDVGGRQLQPYTGTAGTLTASGEFDGQTVAEGGAAICAKVADAGAGEATTKYRIRDWLVSRQRYWGTPIPIVECPSCGDVPVPLDQLPLELPQFEGAMQLTGSAGSPLASLTSWVETECPSCGGPSTRCTDTMDTFVDSSWYYTRYLDSGNEDELCSPQKAAGMPVDLYVGGIEHAVLHLLYARFISYFLHDIGIQTAEEPFQELLTQGMVHGVTYVSAATGQWLTPAQVTAAENGEVVETATGEVVKTVWAKMSKSKHNGVDPGEIIESYGADTARVFTLFKAPPQAVLKWDVESIQGVNRWLHRVWHLVTDQIARHEAPVPGGGVECEEREECEESTTPVSTDLAHATHATIKLASRAYGESFAFNTAIAELMKLSNTLRDASTAAGGGAATALDNQYTDSIRTMLVMLSPAAPHICSELWEAMAGLPSTAQWQPELGVLQQRWPVADESKLQLDVVDLPLQINGKFRGSLQVPSGLLEDASAVQKLALESPTGLKWVPDPSKIVKVIYPDSRRMIGFAVRKK